VNTLTLGGAQSRSYLVVHAPEIVVRQRSLATDRHDMARFESAIERYQGGLSVELPAVFVASLPHARIRQPGFTVASEKDEIFLESAHGLIEVLEENGVMHELLRPKALVAQGSYVLLATPWSERNYYHWMVDALPKLSLLHAIPGGEELPVIIPKELHPYHEQSLAAAGVPRSRQVAFCNRAVQVEHLYYPGLLSPTGYTSPRAVEWLRQTFRPYMSSGRPFRRLYVTRRDARRRILNEDEIVDLLSPEGFEVVCPGDMTLFDQIRLFSEAEVIVGAHGAGLTNTMFAAEGTTLIEFFGSNYINGCFWAITNICRQRHAFASFNTETQDYVASPARVRRILQAALTRSMHTGL
jgi:hypothetical protein